MSWRNFTGAHVVNVGLPTGFLSPELTLSSLTPNTTITVRAIISSPCGSTTLPDVSSTVLLCDSIDFNNDGVSPDTADVEDLLAVFGGGACSNAPACNDIDFNNDGVSPDVEDVDAFLRVYGGGAC
jgi:hypothetical protein